MSKHSSLNNSYEKICTSVESIQKRVRDYMGLQRRLLYRLQVSKQLNYWLGCRMECLRTEQIQHLQQIGKHLYFSCTPWIWSNFIGVVPVELHIISTVKIDSWFSGSTQFCLCEPYFDPSLRIQLTISLTDLLDALQSGQWGKVWGKRISKTLWYNINRECDQSSDLHWAR